MKVEKTKLPGIVIIEPRIFGDERGFFLESFHEKRYAEQAGIKEKFVQDNCSRSTKGVLRGLHFQKTKPQGKLISVNDGEVFDVAVDIDPESETFGQWVGIILSGKNHLQIYVPPGYAHGFVVVSDSADFQYKCTDFYHPDDEAGIRWNDETIAIDWPIDSAPLISHKDAQLPTITEYVDAL